jgi:hypothetical protein
MKLAYCCDEAPFSFDIEGNISEIDYAWRIDPLVQCIQSRNLDGIFYNLWKLKAWAKDKHAAIKYKSTLAFRLTYFLFRRHNKLS